MSSGADNIEDGASLPDPKTGCAGLEVVVEEELGAFLGEGDNGDVIYGDVVVNRLVFSPNLEVVRVDHVGGGCNDSAHGAPCSVVVSGEIGPSSCVISPDFIGFRFLETMSHFRAFGLRIIWVGYAFDVASIGSIC